MGPKRGRHKVCKAIRKIKPDQESFDAEGKPVSQTFSKAKMQELKTAREKVARLEEALALALDKSEYEKLFKLTSGGGGEEKLPQESVQPEGNKT